MNELFGFLIALTTQFIGMMLLLAGALFGLQLFGIDVGDDK